MKSRWMWLAGVGLIVVSGAMAPAQADSNKKSVTLVTPCDRGDQLICGDVNVSNEPLGMAFAIFGDDGNLLPAPAGVQNPTSETSVSPGNVGEIDIPFGIGNFEDGYCEVAVSGTANPDDVRVSLAATGTRMIPGTNTPVYVFNVIEGH